MIINLLENEVLITSSSLKYRIEYLKRAYEKHPYPSTMIEIDILSKVVDNLDSVYSSDLSNRS